MTTAPDPLELEDDDDLLESTDYTGPIPDGSPARATPDQKGQEALAAIVTYQPMSSSEGNTQMLAYAKKAVLAGAIAALTAVLGWNIPGWIDGTSDFEWRSVLGGVVAAFIAGVAVFRASNASKPVA